MFCIFMNQPQWGSWLFGISLLSLSISLVYSLWEISISTQALNVILDDLHLYEGKKLVSEEQNKR